MVSKILLAKASLLWHEQDMKGGYCIIYASVALLVMCCVIGIIIMVNECYA